MESITTLPSKDSVSQFYGCNTCGVKFTTSESQKFHMRSDWHRYNLKRRVSELPTISAELFVEKVKQKQIDINTFTISKSENQDEYGFTVYDRKKKNNRQVTKKDMKRMMRGRLLEQEIIQGAILVRSSSPAGSEFSHVSFQTIDSDSQATDTISNVDTLSVYEELSSPALYPKDLANEDIDTEEEEEEESTDEEDDYDIIEANGCLYCNLKNSTFQELLNHMLQHHGLYIPDKECLVDAEGLIRFLWEILTDYNECLTCGFFGKNVESIQDHCISKGHCRMPYETDEEQALFCKFYKYPEPAKSEKFADSKDIQLDSTGSELALPSGNKIGHRSMMRYYKQNLKDYYSKPNGELTVMAVDRRVQHINLGGLTKTAYDKEFKKMIKQKSIYENVRSRNNSYTKSGRANNRKHLNDPNAH